MLNIVAGIDFEHYPFALAMLDRLDFVAAKVHLAHIVESVLPDHSFPEFRSNHPISLLLAENERQGRLELDTAAKMLSDSGYTLEANLQMGDASRALIEIANAKAAHLIAVGSAKKGTWASLFFGSVTKALTASAEQSILVAKSHTATGKGLRAVFAADHSRYCDDCVDRLLSWGARGIRHVTVVTAPYRLSLDSHDHPEIAQLHADIAEELSARNEKICKRLAEQGIESDHRLITGHPNQAIDAAMHDAKAELLIMGARGHGFWDRLRLGSVSHYQVVATPHNVLVVRLQAPTDAAGPVR